MLILFTGTPVLAQRITTPINSSWSFSKGQTLPNSPSQWQTVSLPHSWNTEDVMDEQPGYFRGVGWYKKILPVTVADKDKRIYLLFEGANQNAEVYINDKIVGQHTGGYTAFQFDISPYLYFDGRPNEVRVKVDNSFNQDVPPLTADFSFFGGIYRDVWLIKTAPVHFGLDKFGSTGIFISTPKLTRDKSSVLVKGSMENLAAEAKAVVLETTIQQRDGKLVQRKNADLVILPGLTTSFSQLIDPVVYPHLWSPADPYLYTVITRIREKNTGRLLDELRTPLGFRWFSFDANEGFSLNGQSLKLVGASRHQDYAGRANAVPDKLAVQDIVLLKQMGANFLRVAHYPQDPSVMYACDSLGILTSVEIPVVNEITESNSFYNNCTGMLIEMIRQNYNHPSVIIWCYMNEVLLRPHFNDDKPRQQLYFEHITQLAGLLDSLARQEDPSRYTMIANHGDFDRYRAAKLTEIPMIVGWNLYSGWYGGTLENFPVFLDKFHQQYPNKPMVVSEYGADADPRIHSIKPLRFDKSVEYSLGFHQYYFREMQQRKFVSAAMIWNLADFNSETREETMPHINNKGLLTWNREPKDLYYFYKANLSTKPFVKIMSGYWDNRAGIADSATTYSSQPLQIATNLDSAELFINGRSLGWKHTLQGIAEWTVPFKDKQNVLEVRAKDKSIALNDKAIINFRLQPWRFDEAAVPFGSVNILLGANRFFTDSKGNPWQPDQPYRNGSWGSIGGKPFKLTGNTRLPYGTDKNIAGTDDDPVYQTQLTGIKEYRLDLPAGNYELIFHFAELQGATGKSLAYNLGDSVNNQQSASRKFDVTINGESFLKDLDLAQSYGTGTAVIIRKTVQVKDTHGIQIIFTAKQGEPVLNALQVRRSK